ncbi:MAG: DUF3152 domain-containing protein [Actinomycetota bacterium]
MSKEGTGGSEAHKGGDLAASIGMHERRRSAALRAPFLLSLLLLAGAGSLAWSDPVELGPADRPSRARSRAATQRSGIVAFDAPARAPARPARAMTEPPVPSKRREGAGATPPRPSGRLRTVPGRSRIHGSGTLFHFDVQVERGLRVARSFAAHVEETLFAPRGWTRSAYALQRVRSGTVAFHVILASPALTDRLCAPALTRGQFSCHNGGRVVINFWRWTNGADSYRGHLGRYRAYVINHEVGHALGRGHVSCPSAGAPAPVMVQQTISVGSCRPNPWPLPGERG